MKKKHNAELEPFCRYCEYAHTLQDKDTVLCEKKGVVGSAHHCRTFRYDPLKRDPAPPRSAQKLDYIPLTDEK